MRSDEQTVDAPGAIQSAVETSQKSLEGVGRHRAKGESPGCEDRHGFDTLTRKPFEEPADFVVCVREPPSHLLAFDEKILFEVRERRLLANERVRFLQQGDDAHAHGDGS
jgi:hypothetical protein